MKKYAAKVNGKSYEIEVEEARSEEERNNEPSIRNIRKTEPSTMNLWSLAGRLERLRNNL